MKKNDLLECAEEVEAFACYLLFFAKNIRKKALSEENSRLFWPESNINLSETAQAILNFRQNRSLNIDKSLLFDTAWDMLLILFKDNMSAKGVPIESLCELSGASESTGRRWVSVLVNEGLAELASLDGESPGQRVRLSEMGVLQMTKTMIDAQTILFRARAGFPQEMPLEH